MKRLNMIIVYYKYLIIDVHTSVATFTLLTISHIIYERRYSLSAFHSNGTPNTIEWITYIFDFKSVEHTKKESWSNWWLFGEFTSPSEYYPEI